MWQKLPANCQNLICDIYTACLNHFPRVYCEANNIITAKQSTVKKAIWGYAEQLLTNCDVVACSILLSSHSIIKNSDLFSNLNSAFVRCFKDFFGWRLLFLRVLFSIRVYILGFCSSISKFDFYGVKERCLFQDCVC